MRNNLGLMIKSQPKASIEVGEDNLFSFNKGNLGIIGKVVVEITSWRDA